MVDGIGTTRFTYTPAGFLQSEDGPWPSDTVTHTFNNNLQRTGLTLAQSSGSPWTQNFAYDSARRLLTLTSPAGSFGYDYVSGSRLTKKLTLPNTSYITNVYDAVAQLKGTSLRKNNDAILNYHGYGYDQLGQRTNTIRTAGDFAEYRYDPAGQLKQVLGFEVDGVTARLHEKFGYAYDAANNLTHRTNNQLVATFAPDSRNRLSSASRSGTATVRGTTTSAATSVTVNGSGSSRYADNTFASAGHSLVNGNNSFTAVAQDSYGRADTNIVTAYLPDSSSFAYDANGNLLWDGVQAHGYDGENQLTNIVVTNAWQVVFRYDGLLRRRVKQEYAWQNGVWVLTNEVRYVYDGMLVLQERDRFNIPQVTYTRGLDLSATFDGAGGIGGLLARTDSSLLNPQHSYYHADGNGNVTALADAQQRLTAQYIYDPFGNVISMSGPLAAANTYRFSSKEIHPNSGYYYYGYRYYSPHLQRWINEDPIGEESDINLYRFVFNETVGWLDPDGLAGGPGSGSSSPRPGPRPSTRRGEITEELGGYIREGKEGRHTLRPPASSAEKAAEAAARRAGQERQARENPGHKPGNTYLECPKRPAPPKPMTPEELQKVNFPTLALSEPAPIPRGGTYIQRDAITGQVMRNGRSRNLQNRERQLARDPVTKDLTFERDLLTDSYPQQRGREDVIHDRYKPPMNKIRPISECNPRRQEYLDSVKDIP